KLCDLPRPSAVRISRSQDTETHGQKLYFLFAKERADYVRPSGKPQPVGQVVVKEDWVPQEVQNEETIDPRSEDPIRTARKEGRMYHTSERAGLYIMMKMDPSTPDTDEGWVYGTLSACKTKVTSAGRLASCMACHQEA